VAAVGDAGISTEFESHLTVLQTSFVDGFTVDLHGLDLANTHADVFVRDTERGSLLEYSFLHFYSNDDWVLCVENGSLDHLEHAREYGTSAQLYLSCIAAFLHVSSEVIEKMIDNLSLENLDSFCVSELLGIRHDSDVETK